MTFGLIQADEEAAFRPGDELSSALAGLAIDVKQQAVLTLLADEGPMTQ